MTWVGMIRTPSRPPFMLVVKTAIAITISWFLSIWLLGQQYPVFAAIAALLVVAPSVNQSFGKGIQRSLGVILGVALAWLAGMAFGVNTVMVLALVVVAVIICWLLRLPPMASNQVPISAMLMLALGGASDAAMASDRIVETVIGAAVALVINVAIVPPLNHGDAERELRRLADEIAEVFDDVARALRGEHRNRAGLLQQGRALRTQTARVRDAMSDMADSLQLNPRGRRLRDRIVRDEDLLRILTILTNRAIGMARTVADHGDLEPDPMLEQIATELERISHDVRLLVQRHEHEDAATTSLPVLADPALTTPISVPAPHPRQWVFIGALLEDVRQVRDSLADGFADER